jgi:hypothetical protein
MIPDSGERKPTPYVTVPNTEGVAAFSPDGKWITYMSNESGRNEVYVTGCPRAGAKWQVSSDGGLKSWWIGGGRRIAYLTENAKLFAADVTEKNGAPVPGAREALLRGQTVAGPLDFTPDGRRILMIVPLERQTNLSPVTDWRAGLPAC